MCKRTPSKSSKVQGSLQVVMGGQNGQRYNYDYLGTEWGTSTNRAVEYHTLILLWNLFLKRHYETEVYTFFLPGYCKAQELVRPPYRHL